MLTSAASSNTAIWTETGGTCTFAGGSSTGTYTTSSGVSVSVRCPSAGTYTFTLVINSASSTTDTFSITFSPSNHQWYSVVYNQNSTAISTVLSPGMYNYVLRLWIVDPLSSLASTESSGTALTPSSVC